MPLSTGQVVRVAARQKSANNTDIVNVFYFRSDDDFGDDDVTILESIRTWLETAYNDIEGQIPTAQIPYDLKGDVVELVGGVVTIVRNMGLISWGNTYDPSGAGEAMPLGVAILIILRTVVGKVFGRKFIGQISEVTTSGNSLATGAPTTAFVAFASKLITTVSHGAGTLTPGILSTRTLAFEPFVEADIATEVGYQRRRAVRHGS